MAKIGIDLGTTNSLAAYFTDDGPKIIPNAFGENLTPSIVSIDENGEILVGKIAKERLITHPELTAATFKRYMGTDKVYRLGEYVFSPEDLSSFVVKSLKEDAEAFLKEEISEAVISVPAYFNDSQRKATKHAAELAGLKVERLISEPTAAAISYGIHLRDADTKFLVFDLGGGTFDVSILEMFEGIMEVKSIAGDNFLGGEDFTNLLISYFLENQKIDADSLDKKEHSAIYKQAEFCKIDISNNNIGKMKFIKDDETYERQITKNEFEKLANYLLTRLRLPIERALRDASLTPEELDAVILIGGATRMPFIKSVVSKMFGKLPYSNINPDEAVALGAAVQVALKERNKKLEEIILTDVCPYTLGVEIVHQVDKGRFEAGHFLPIIERNTLIPVSKVERLCTTYDGQAGINVTIYQGESRLVKNNIKLGNIEIKLPPAPAGRQQIDVRYTYDINGILEVEVTAVETGVKERAVIQENPGSMTEEEVEKRLEALKSIKIHPRERAENRYLIARAERLYEESLGEKRAYISMAIDKFESVLEKQNEIDIKKAAEIFKQELDSVEGDVTF